MMDYQGKVVLVTGAARGIGAMIAEHFTCLGATVAECDLDAIDPMLRIDLTKPYAGVNLVSNVQRRHGRLDYLINNARWTGRGLLGDESEDDWDAEMSVGVKTPYFLGKYAIKAGASAIVNIGSVTSFTVSGESAGYQVAKGACQQLTRVLAALGASRGCRCNCVLPGAIVKGDHPKKAEMKNVHLAADWGTPEDVAHVVEFLCSEKARFVNGASMVLDGGLTINDVWQTWQKARAVK